MLFFTDPHLGTPRQANTTPASAAALQQALFDQAMLVTGSLYRAQGQPVVCLGDVLDRYSNPEPIVLQAHRLVSQCSSVLSGNHDITNRETGFGSLQLVDQVIRQERGTSPCIFAKFGEPCAVAGVGSGLLLAAAVPHVANQELFEQSLGMAMDLFQGASSSYRRVLLLHCNYNLSESYATETSLNLLDEHVDELLEVYDYILLGHEHAPAEHRDGRVIVIGNTHPTGFGDISDKRVLVWEQDRFRSESIWSMADGYAEYDCGAIPRSSTANFVRVTGTTAVNEMLGVSRAVSEMWQRSPNLFGVKLELKLPELAGVDRAEVSRGLSQLPDIIRRELEAHPKLLALWDQLTNEETSNG